jgi:GntR family transcriptional regulator/MocR family aminotransferase
MGPLFGRGSARIADAVSTWLPDLDLAEPDSTSPGYVQLARAIARDLARGRLSTGQRLPGSRTLATRLGVARNTVIAAYSELEVEGWLRSEGARGTFVAERLSNDRPRRFAPTLEARAVVPRQTGFDLGPPPRLLGGADALVSGFASPRSGLLRMGGGMPDPRLCPAELIGRTLRRLLTREPGLLDYASDDEAGRGHPRLREVLARTLAEVRGLACGPEHLLIARGAQMCLWLSAAALLRPGDRVAVERWGYRPAWQALRAHGARLVPINVDARGLDVDQLERALERGPLRAVYLTPHHQYPTTAALAPGRRLRLLELARQHRFAILEDDYDNEYHYEGRPLLPLASADRHGLVVYVGSMAKVLAPGLRLGWVVAPEPLIERMVALRRPLDRQGDRLGERAFAELLEEGELQRHVRRTRRIMQGRRDALVDALGRELGEVVIPRVPAGGLALWARVDPNVDVDTWAARALAAGVEVTPGRIYEFRRRPRSRLRIGFARCDEGELALGVRRLARALPEGR